MVVLSANLIKCQIPKDRWITPPPPLLSAEYSWLEGLLIQEWQEECGCIRWENVDKCKLVCTSSGWKNAWDQREIKSLLRYRSDRDSSIPGAKKPNISAVKCHESGLYQSISLKKHVFRGLADLLLQVRKSGMDSKPALQPLLVEKGLQWCLAYFPAPSVSIAVLHLW